ncbi:S1 RNA-binding domain-containing protein [Floricoccus penangensis]|uniref:S1 RNA-binding domain-containing protein n=1 Tax=Floricoccus penangensis TaxID=1859475 RepID=UPI00203AF935|nr:S1 RNA-binding domain-containing protein [Floricoccus penangensis]URZ87497.1 S1 RNA-binding domain-containing protein [Floricoccus penangensis]
MIENQYKISNITKFGIFVDLDDNRTGLVRWSNVPKNEKYHIGDYVSINILNTHPDGKIDLEISTEDFNDRFENFISTSYIRLAELQEKNKHIRDFIK